MTGSIGTSSLYTSFTVLGIALLAVDFAMLKKPGAHAVDKADAAGWSVVWVTIALAFGALFWWYMDGIYGPGTGRSKALAYGAGYLFEKSLALDNVLLWIVLVEYFAVPAPLQKRVLAYAVLGAVLMRAILIWLGAAALARFHWIIWPFGLLLLVTGMRMLAFARREPDLAANPVLRWLRAHLRTTGHYHGERFVVRLEGLRHATPLLLVLVLAEAGNLVFAVDAIPAIFAVTRDPFIVFSTNLFAILGMRAAFFLMAGATRRFYPLKAGLAALLIVVGAKVLLGAARTAPVVGG